MKEQADHNRHYNPGPYKQECPGYFFLPIPTSLNTRPKWEMESLCTISWGLVCLSSLTDCTCPRVRECPSSGLCCFLRHLLRAGAIFEKPRSRTWNIQDPYSQYDNWPMKICGVPFVGVDTGIIAVWMDKTRSYGVFYNQSGKMKTN